MSELIKKYSKRGSADLQKAVASPKRTAEEIEKSIPTWMRKKLIRYHDNLLGMIALERGNLQESMALLRRAAQTLYYPEENFDQIQAYFRFTLAQALYRGGDLFGAREELEKILSLHLGRIGDGDFYARSLFILGKIFEQQGQKEKAIEHLQHLIELWKDADLGMKEVEDARALLASLT